MITVTVKATIHQTNTSLTIKLADFVFSCSN